MVFQTRRVVRLWRKDVPVDQRPTVTVRPVRASMEAEIRVGLEDRHARAASVHGSGFEMKVVAHLTRAAIVDAHGLTDDAGQVVPFAAAPREAGAPELCAADVYDALTELDVSAILAVARYGIDPAKVEAEVEAKMAAAADKAAVERAVREVVDDAQAAAAREAEAGKKP